MKIPGLKAGLGCIGLLVVAFVFVMIVIGTHKATPEQEVERASVADGYTAAFHCQDAVRARLKAPAGAEFQAPRRADITKFDDGYKIVSYVDAANSFGAKLRTPFTCLVEQHGAEFKVIDLKIEKRR